MKIEHVDEAITEAKRFIRKAGAVRVKYMTDKYLCGCKETGACKRSSMDLTRALALMRKS